MREYVFLQIFKVFFYRSLVTVESSLGISIQSGIE